VICQCRDSAGKLRLRRTWFWEENKKKTISGIRPTELSGQVQRICQASLGICHSSLVTLMPRDIDCLEKIQRRAIKMVKGFHKSVQIVCMCVSMYVSL